MMSELCFECWHFLLTFWIIRGFREQFGSHLLSKFWFLSRFSQAPLEDCEVQRLEGDPHGRFRWRKQEGVHSRIKLPGPFVCTSALVGNFTIPTFEMWNSLFYLSKVVHSSIKWRFQRATCHFDPLVSSFALGSQPFEAQSLGNYR